MFPPDTIERLTLLLRRAGVRFKSITNSTPPVVQFGPDAKDEDYRIAREVIESYTEDHVES